MPNLTPIETTCVSATVRLTVDLEPVRDASGDVMMSDGEPIIREKPQITIPKGVEHRISLTARKEIIDTILDEHGFDDVDELYEALDREIRLGCVDIANDDITYKPRSWVTRKL